MGINKHELWRWGSSLPAVQVAQEAANDSGSYKKKKAKKIGGTATSIRFLGSTADILEMTVINNSRLTNS
jgi:hypothetical protein